jgi:hypothetical protein
LEQACFVALLERERSLETRSALPPVEQPSRVTRPDDLFNVPGVQLYLQDPHPRNADFAIKYTKLKAHGMRILIQPSDALQ